MENTPPQLDPATANPNNRKRLYAVLVSLLVLSAAGIFWYFNGPNRSSETSAQQSQAEFYFEPEAPEYFLNAISGLQFFIKPFNKTMRIEEPIKTKVTMEKPDGSKATKEVVLEVNPAYNGCYEKDTNRCPLEQLYFRQQPFTFYGFDNNFFSVDQVGTWKLTSSNGIIKSLAFEVKGSIITSLFIGQNIGGYKFTESNDMGSRGNHHFYTGSYLGNDSFLQVLVAVKNSNSDFKMEYDNPAYVGNINLQSAPVITFNGNKIKVNDCGECDINKGSANINFSLGWPTKDGFINMYGGVGDKYGEAEKEVVKQYLIKYPSILK